MIGLDTNVIVRYIVKDDPTQSAFAIEFIRSLSADDRAFVSLVVTAELIWVLDSCYGFSKSELVDVIQSLLSSKELILENAELVSQAAHLFGLGSADFSDYVIEKSGRAAGCSHTVTFDQKAASFAGMRLLE
jgi:predicted nucleic-acid-binding protein